MKKFPKEVRVVWDNEDTDDPILMTVENDAEMDGRDGQRIATYLLVSVGTIKITKEIVGAWSP